MQAHWSTHCLPQISRFVLQFFSIAGTSCQEVEAVDEAVAVEGSAADVVGSAQATCRPWGSPLRTSSPCRERRASYILYVVFWYEMHLRVEP